MMDALTRSAEATGPYATPPVLAFARSLGIDLARVAATGPRGRILREDVERYVRAQLRIAAQPAATVMPMPVAPAQADIDFSKFGPVERQPLSRIKRLSGPALARAWQTIPHVTNFDVADVTDLEAFRVSLNDGSRSAKVTTLAFLIKASAAALKAFPDINASLSGQEIVRKRYVHIGFAVDTPGGLVVPVIRDCDAKGVRELAAEMAELAGRARDGKLKATEMQGGCFSISSLGGIGGTGFTPIINAPEVAILGAARSEMKPVWNGSAFVPRLMLPLCLSWDHRVIDGAMAARFLSHLSGLLGDLRRVGL